MFSLEFKTNDTNKNKQELEQWIFEQEKKAVGKLVAINAREAPPETGVRTETDPAHLTAPPGVPTVMVTPSSGGTVPAGKTKLAAGTAFLSGQKVNVLVFR